MDGLDSTTSGIIALAAAIVAVLALGTAVTVLVRIRRLRADQRVVLGDAGGEDLIAAGAAARRRVEQLAGQIGELSQQLTARLDRAEERLDGSVSRTAVVRYDAFNETSGRQSSSIALLDDRGDGVVLSAILQREQARVYAKPVRSGRSELDLSPEEEEALQRAAGGAES